MPSDELVVFKHAHSKETRSIKACQIGRITGGGQYVAEVRIADSRCTVPHDWLTLLNGHHPELRKSLDLIDNARGIFRKAVRNDAPAYHLNRCSDLLGDIARELGKACPRAASEIGDCRLIVKKLIQEIEDYGEIRYRHGAKHFFKHIETSEIICGQTILAAHNQGC